MSASRRPMPAPQPPRGSGPGIDSGSVTKESVLLFTPEEAAVMLRVRPSWLRKKSAAGLIPRTFLGRHLRFSAADLAAIVELSARPATGTGPRSRRRRRRGGSDLPGGGQGALIVSSIDDPGSERGRPWPG
jgi:excisionase family DNA binding protein